MSQQRVLMQIDGEPEKKGFPTVQDATALFLVVAKQLRLYGKTIRAGLYYEVNGVVEKTPRRELWLGRNGGLRQSK